jgi:hypothetical protein
MRMAVPVTPLPPRRHNSSILLSNWSCIQCVKNNIDVFFLTNVSAESVFAKSTKEMADSVRIGCSTFFSSTPIPENDYVCPKRTILMRRTNKHEPSTTQFWHHGGVNLKIILKNEIKYYTTKSSNRIIGIIKPRIYADAFRQLMAYHHTISLKWFIHCMNPLKKDSLTQNAFIGQKDSWPSPKSHCGSHSMLFRCVFRHINNNLLLHWQIL